MAALEALIFDVDGTLAETEELHRRAFNEAFAEAGLDWRWGTELYRDLLKVTGGKERMLHYAAAYRPHERAPAEEQLRALHARKTERYAALVETGAVRLRPGFARLLAEAREAGMRLAIATTTSPPNVAALLRATLGPASERLFEVIVAGDAAARKKPFPDAYELALAELGLTSASCIAFEDSANGLRAARGAGLATIVTPSLYTADEDFDGALAVLSHLGDPGEPYLHMAGAGAGDGLVVLARLRHWLDGGPRGKDVPRAARPPSSSGRNDHSSHGAGASPSSGILR